MKNVSGSPYLRKIVSALMGVTEGPDLDGALTFALSNKLLYACVSSGILDKHDCFGELDRQKRARLKVKKTLVDLHNEFLAAGVRYAVIKGFAFEQAIYGGLRMRDVGDIDLLIMPEDALSAHKVLCGMGFRQQLGPSSGSIASLGRARFVARISQQKYAVSVAPLRRFPYKDAYCPYVKPGYPAVELHDGFRGLPGWYTNEAVERARGNRLSLMEDKLDTMQLLLANTYENAESFYSNCFDDKIVLRDFVDLAWYFSSVEKSLDWGAAEALIRTLGIVEKAGRVLHDFDNLLPGEADGVFSRVPRLESYWGANVCDRVNSFDVRRRGVLQVIRADIKTLAGKAWVGLSDVVRGNQSFSSGVSEPIAYSLAKSDDGVVLRVDGARVKRDGSCMVEFGFFPIAGVEPPLCGKVSVLLEKSSPIAYCRAFDRIPDGFSVWSQAGVALTSCYGDRGEVIVVVPHEVADALLFEGETAITAGVYDRKHGNVFWARCRGKARLTGGVPIGHLSLYCGSRFASVVVEFSFARCSIASNDASLLALLLAVFEGATVGVPVDCDSKSIRGYIVICDMPGAYTVEVGGMPRGRGLSRKEASSLLVQDITDWVVSELVEESVLAHASSNLARNGAVLCMGPSGSGKTSLALALAKYWPLRSDECSCIELAAGTTWAEPLPVNVKSNNEYGLSLASGDEALVCELGSCGRTFCFNRSIVRFDSKPFEHIRIEAIVFPAYDEEAPVVEIGRLAYDTLIPLILGSLLGKECSSGLLGEFVRMISACDIRLLAVRYCDAAAAAMAVVESVEGKGASCDV